MFYPAFEMGEMPLQRKGNQVNFRAHIDLKRGTFDLKMVHLIMNGAQLLNILCGTPDMMLVFASWC